MVYIEKYGARAAVLLGVIIAGIAIVRIAGFITERTLSKNMPDSALAGFVSAAVKSLLWLVLLFVCAYVAGIPNAPLIALLGSAGLALSLALKDNLSNLAGGIIMMGTKPFAAGDYVDIDGTEGTVRRIKLTTSELVTPDNKKILIPNSTVMSARITNYSARNTRRLEFAVSVAFDTDLDKLRALVIRVLEASQYTLPDPSPTLVFTGSGNSSLDLSARAWVRNDDYWDAYWNLGETLVREILDAGIQIPYEKLDVFLEQKNRRESNGAEK